MRITSASFRVRFAARARCDHLLTRCGAGALLLYFGSMQMLLWFFITIHLYVRLCWDLYELRTDFLLWAAIIIPVGMTVPPLVLEVRVPSPAFSQLTRRRGRRLPLTERGASSTATKRYFFTPTFTALWASAVFWARSCGLP